MILSPRPSNNIASATRWSAAGRIAYHADGGIRICREDGGGDHLPAPGAVSGDLCLHPDGKRMCYSRSENRYDVFVLDGLPRPATGWLRLFRHCE